MVGNFRKKYGAFMLLGGILLVHWFLLFQTVFWPAQEFRTFPYLTSMGLVPYKDIVDQHFPGLFFFPVNLFSLGLATPGGLRFIQLLLVAITQIGIFIFTKKKTQSILLAVLISFSYLFIQIFFEGYVLWVDSFIPPLLFVSFILLENAHSTSSWMRYFIAGILIAIACFFKQTAGLVGITVVLYLMVTKVKAKNIIAFFGGFTIPLVSLFLYEAIQGAWNYFVEYTVIFNLTIYSRYGGRAPTIKEIILLGLIILPTIGISIYGIFQKKRNFSLLILVFVLPLLFFLGGRYDFVHFQPFLPFAAIVFISPAFSKKTQTFLISIFLILFLILYITHTPRLGRYTTFLEDTRGGQQLIYALQGKKNVYIENYHQELYQLTHTLPPGNFYPDYIDYPMWNKRKFLGNKLLKSLEIDKPMIIVREKGKGSDSRIDRYISSNYVQSQEIADVELLKRK